MTLGSQLHVQLVDINFFHEYADASGYHDLVADVPEDERNDPLHFHLSVPLHPNATVEPETPSFGYTTATVNLFDDGFVVQIPHAPSAEWMFVAHRNVLAYVEREYTVTSAEEEFRATYAYGLPHPLLSVERMVHLLPMGATEVDSLDTDWFDPEQTTLAYEFSDGRVYAVPDTDELHLVPSGEATEADLQSLLGSLTYQALCEAIEETEMYIADPYPDLFDTSVLYEAFYESEAAVHLWNAVADDLFARDFTNEPTPDLRTHLQDDLGLTAGESMWAWIRLLASLEFNLPVTEHSWDLLDEHLGAEHANEEGSYTINWFGGLDLIENAGLPAAESAEFDYHDYDREDLPEADLIEIHANDGHMMLAAEPFGYCSYIDLLDEELVDDDIEEYFWAEGMWVLKIRALRPCGVDAEDANEENPAVFKQVMDYATERNGPFAIALAENLDEATPISEATAEETMLPYPGSDSE
jgi:hypothetical protein